MEIVAYIGLDWADAAHSVHLQAADGHVEHVTVAQRPEVLQAWIADLQQRFPRGRIAVLSDGDTVSFSAPTGARLILVAGKPLREPVAKHGPFVMNTHAELVQAFEDFQAGRF